MRVRDFWPHVVSSSEGKEAKCAMTLVMTPLYIKLDFMLVLGWCSLMRNTAYTFVLV